MKHTIQGRDPPLTLACSHPRSLERNSTWRIRMKRKGRSDEVHITFNEISYPYQHTKQRGNHTFHYYVDPVSAEAQMQKSMIRPPHFIMRSCLSNTGSSSRTPLTSISGLSVSWKSSGHRHPAFDQQDASRSETVLQLHLDNVKVLPHSIQNGQI